MSETHKLDDLATLLRTHVPAVLRAVQGSTVEELRLEDGGTVIAIRRAVQDAPRVAGEAAAVDPDTAHFVHLAAPGRSEIRAQVVGVFHRARVADGPALAEIGERVDAGRAIGVIETLGIANDVVAPIAGRLDELTVQDGQAVEYGELIAAVVPEDVATR